MSDLYLERQADFDAFAESIAQAPLLAVDTEAASFHRYRDRVYLIQLSTRDRTAVVDPLTVTNLSALGRLLEHPGIEVIFHDADYDLRILDRDYGFHASELFDTRIAAQLLNEPGIGLAALLEKYLGVTLDKKYQRADWSVRPLTPEMLAYAASDTKYLPRLRDILRERLAEKGRWSWAEEEFDLLKRVRWAPSGPPEEAYLRLKGARSLRGHELAVLRELFAWREQAASQLDRAPFRILQNEAMLAIAKAMPADPTALRELKVLSPDQLRRRGNELLEAVARGVGAPASSLPVFERTKRPAPDLAFDARLERLKQVRNAVAERIELAPGVLCPNGLLEAIARLVPRSTAQLSEIPEMRRWQREVLGPELLAAVPQQEP
ncbi:MAG TPA: ribonuclease D [Gemmatimonadales bacterium]|nr:ribonuclease D [Gemmatimonadales bacterium]